jgi:hypothetical protein
MTNITPPNLIENNLLYLSVGALGISLVLSGVIYICLNYDLITEIMADILTNTQNAVEIDLEVDHNLLIEELNFNQPDHDGVGVGFFRNFFQFWNWNFFQFQNWNFFRFQNWNFFRGNIVENFQENQLNLLEGVRFHLLPEVEQEVEIQQEVEVQQEVEIQPELNLNIPREPESDFTNFLYNHTVERIRNFQPEVEVQQEVEIQPELNLNPRRLPENLITQIQTFERPNLNPRRLPENLITQIQTFERPNLNPRSVLSDLLEETRFKKFLDQPQKVQETRFKKFLDQPQKVQETILAHELFNILIVQPDGKPEDLTSNNLEFLNSKRFLSEELQIKYQFRGIYQFICEDIKWIPLDSNDHYIFKFDGGKKTANLFNKAIDTPQNMAVADWITLELSIQNIILCRDMFSQSMVNTIHPGSLQLPPKLFNMVCAQYFQDFTNDIFHFERMYLIRNELVTHLQSDKKEVIKALIRKHAFTLKNNMSDAQINYLVDVANDDLEKKSILYLSLKNKV